MQQFGLPNSYNQQRRSKKYRNPNQGTGQVTNDSFYKCGWVRKGNRNGKRFKCDRCPTDMDSDLNASLNLTFDLMPIGQKERLSKNNRTGFYWKQTGQESIVPGTR